MTDRAHPQPPSSPDRAPSPDSVTGRGHPPVLGMLGGGQLGRMTAQAAERLGVITHVYDPSDSGATGHLKPRTVGAWDDDETMRRFLEQVSVVTVENEWTPFERVVALAPEGVELYPSATALGRICDKIDQKEFAAKAGIPVGDFRSCRGLEETRAAIEAFGLPVVLKSATEGYDGYGTRTVESLDQLPEFYAAMERNGRVLVERFVPFVRELSVVTVRGRDGQVVTYPVAFTVQEDHRCGWVEVPSPASPEVEAKALEIAVQAANAFETVGVLAVELFELEDGSLTLNEVAPRPHNSGHFTIDACVTSQFENHVRAVLGWPLGSTEMLRPAAVMANVLGKRSGATENRGVGDALAFPDTYVHLYGKQEVRPQRKMGHVTSIGADLDTVRERAQTAAEKIDP